MKVDGNLRNGKLALETEFAVYITYKDTLSFGINNSSKEKEYVCKSVGISEKYHK